MKIRKWVEWLVVFSLLGIITVYTFFSIGVPSMRLVSAYSEEPRNFYYNNWMEINLAGMLNLLYNNDFEITKMNHTFNEIVGEYEFTRTEEAFVVNVTGFKDYSYRECDVLRKLMEHPEILARFPEIDDEDSNIPMWRLNGVNCLHTQGGGIATALGISSGGVS